MSWKAAMLGVLLALSTASARADELYARVVDVGNALCVIIRVPGDNFMLYDAGNYTGSQCQNAVRSIVGDHRIGLIVLSHSDSDHIGEMAEILTAYKGRVDQLVYTGRQGTSTVTWPETLTAIKHPDTKPLNVIDLAETDLPNVVDSGPGGVRAGPRTFPLGPATVTIVAGWSDWPYPPGDMDDSERNNVVSIVARVDYGGKSILLTGDTIGRTGKRNEPFDACIGAEEWMVRNAAPLIDADVLIGQHHGGDNSSARCFIEAVSPRFVVFPAGHVNNYKHVRLSTARRYTGNGSPGAAMIVPGGRMFQTDRGDDQGAIEWSPQRIQGCVDRPGDDDVEVYLPDQAAAPARVRYRNRDGPCGR